MPPKPVSNLCPAIVLGVRRLSNRAAKPVNSVVFVDVVDFVPSIDELLYAALYKRAFKLLSLSSLALNSLLKTSQSIRLLEAPLAELFSIWP